MLGALDPTDRAPDAAVTLRGGRYVIPIRSTARARVGGIVHDESATRSTVFVEPPEVIELGNALRAAEAEEQREVLRVLRELTDLLRPHRGALATAWEMCIAFDDLCARARYAVEVNGFAPAIGAGPLAIRNGRHPLLVGGEAPVVPFDLVLAAAVLRTLTRRRVVTLATTHLGALKQLAAQTVGIVNASLQFEAETLTPTYRLLKGVPGRSYGLAIARRLGIPPDVLDMAERAVPDTERALDALLATVEARARELETKQREIAERDAALREDAGRVEARADEVTRREHEVKARAQALERAARDQTRAYLLEARRKVEEALGRARAAVDEATAREARRLLEQAIEETTGETGGEKAGERAGEGEKEKGWVSLEDLKRTRGKPPQIARPPDRLTAAVATAEISLRGLRLDEAEPVLVKALDDAVAADLPYLRVIHGKGTGAVRKLVHEILSADSRR